MDMDVIKRAVYAIYSKFTNWYGARRALIFLDERFGCLTRKYGTFSVYAGYYRMLSGDHIACMPAVNMPAVWIEKAAGRIEEHADEQSSYTAAEYAEMCTTLKAEIKALRALNGKLNRARILRDKYFDTIGSGAQAVLRAYRELTEHNAVKQSDINNGSLVLWAYLQGVRSERARHRGAGKEITQ